MARTDAESGIRAKISADPWSTVFLNPPIRLIYR